MLPNGWKIYSVGELTENFDARRIPVRELDRETGPYPYYGASGIVDHVNDYLFEGEYLLVAEDGENLRSRQTPIAFMANGKFWVNNHAHIVRGNALALTRFLAYALQTTDISGYLTGSTLPKLTQANLNRIPILSPPLGEQQRIIRVLGTLDDKIDMNKRMNETLEELAHALFKSWFVDFDPVRERASGENPPGIAAKFPALFSTSRIGRVPSGWDVAPITSRARLLSGGTPKTSRADYWDGDIPWCSAKDVSQATETVLLATERTITAKGLHESATQLIPPWCTVVVARGATTGRMVLLGREMAMNQTCYALESSIGTPLSLYCQLRVEIGSLVHAAHGSVFDTITTTTFANSLVTRPPESLLLGFEREVKPLFARILSNTKESRTLAALRETLLRKLISGQIRLNQAEKIIEANA
jgi:type I restriction enzyme S subunit